MLVLTRKTDESIYIGDNIKITLVRIKGGSVRIGIEAPDDIRIKRAELRDRRQDHDGAGDRSNATPDLRALTEVLRMASNSPDQEKKPTPRTRETQSSSSTETPTPKDPCRRNHIPRPALEKFMSA